MARHVATLAVLASFCAVPNGAAMANEMAQPMPAMAQPAQAQAQTREAFVRGITSQVLGILHNPGSSLSTKKAQLENTFMRMVDLNWIAQFVVGKPWEAASQQERAQYVALYGKYLSSTYLAGLDENSGKNLRDIQLLSMDDAFDDAFFVHTQMVMAQGDNLRVDYLVREEAGQRKIIDIVLEGVSLLKTHREELGAVAHSGGMQGVIAALHDRMMRGETHLAFAGH